MKKLIKKVVLMGIALIGLIGFVNADCYYVGLDIWVSEGYAIPHPDVDKFFLCLDGRLVQGTCPQGFYFSEESQDCLRPL
ncbi:chitin binding peritrophin-A domain-containing protein [Sphingobacterium paucimobilis]|uniref:Chitin-binding type-2 domain-containing protein n=1 Tax=Sphingobacterium paucimobilis HER1398 TaxID=1346330 RepID=U2HY05_9SPHI|nr:chitin binding peritrophin-A domain-containing protein [Sphingobacterium paucimobilis]ERJ60145.1 hypothetical protein M472_15385 [Sphingobacterium paucimobilis HER1398]